MESRKGGASTHDACSYILDWREHVRISTHHMPPEGGLYSYLLRQVSQALYSRRSGSRLSRQDAVTTSMDLVFLIATGCQVGQVE